MDSLFGFFSGIDEIRFTKGGNFVDRLHYKYTPMLLGMGAVIMLLLQFAAEFSISCWCPAQFTDSMVEYTNRKCWVTRTYHVPFANPDIPREEENLEYISYYQFVPAILFLQAFMMFIPSQLWRSISNFSGINVSKIVDKALRYDQTEDGEERDGIVFDVVNRFHSSDENVARSRWQQLKGKLRRNMLPFVYLVMKTIYFLNLMWQMKFTNWMLGGDEMRTYVASVIREVAGSGVWPESIRFPTVTMCDFSMRVLHNVQDYTVQCTLPLNFYHDKLFVIVWLWFAILAVVTLVDWVSWLLWLILDVILTMLKGSDRIPSDHNIKRFMYRYFGANGLYMRRMIQKNVGGFASFSIMNGMKDKIQELDDAKTSSAMSEKPLLGKEE